MTNWITRTVDRMFPVPTADELAVRELQDARRELLKAQTARSYAEAMVMYNMERIKRLDAALKTS